MFGVHRLSAGCRACPPEPPALPLRCRGVHWTAVSASRKKAVTNGLLPPVGEYVPHRRAGLYRFSEKAASLPPPLLRLLPGGAIQFPGGFISRCGPVPFTAYCNRLFTSTIRRSIRFCGRMPDEHGPPAFCFCAINLFAAFFSCVGRESPNSSLRLERGEGQANKDWVL